MCRNKNPFTILCERNCTETYGECFGAAVCYSGNFAASVEVTPIDTVRFVMGIHTEGFHWHLNDGESFTTPEVVFSYSAEGIGKLSQNYHKIIRNLWTMAGLVHEITIKPRLVIGL